jgi:tRNA A37 threonylcarbamoyladenosine dehydratase
MTTYAIIGCGGIGYALAPIVTRMLMASQSSLYLVDGKTIRTANLARQFATTDVGQNKAEALADTCRRLIPIESPLKIHAVASYLEPATVEQHEWLQHDDLVVFLAADTKASRVAVERILDATDSNFTLIAGGNNEWDGQAVITRRHRKRYLDPLPSEVNPDLLDNDGRTPSMIPCDEAAVSEPQLVIANVQTAVCMVGLWYSQVLNKPKKPFNHVAFNMKTPEVFPSVRVALEGQVS